MAVETKRLETALQAIGDKQAKDILVLDISAIASFADYFILCSGDSKRQIQAIVDEIQERMRKSGFRPQHVEGYRNAEWVLLDFVDLVVHVFSKQARSYYDLERLWRDGTPVDPGRLLARRSPKSSAPSRSGKSPAPPS